MKKTQLCICFVVIAMLGDLSAQKIGLQLYSLRNEMAVDVDGTFDALQSWGIKHVEGGNLGTYGMANAEYLEYLADHDLHIASMAASFEALRDNPDSVITNALELDVKYVVCFWIPHNGDEFTIQHVQLALEVFERAGKLAAAKGVTLCYHPHGYEFRPFEGTTLIDYMLSRSEHFQFEIDVFWVKHAGTEPLELMRKYPDRFPLMHAKDRRHGTKGNANGRADVETNVVLGKGDVGIEAIMLEARKMGIEYIFIEDESSRSMQQIPMSFDYIKEVLNH